MKRLDSLDALRGVAALLVVVQHVLERATPDLLLLRTCHLGLLAVEVFFLLSGFVVPSSLAGPQPLRRFAISRVARLIPALWLSVAVMAVINHGTAPQIAANMAMLAQPLGFERLSSVYWTLTYELAFYFACAALYACGLLSNPRVIGAMVLTALLLALANFAPLIYGAYLLFGLLLRIDLVEGDRQARPWTVGCLIALLAMGCYYGLMARSGDLHVDGLPRMTGMVLAPLVFLGVVVWRPQPARWLVWLGAISYSLYLFHEALIDIAYPLLASNRMVYGVLVIVGSVVVAALVHHFVEKPCIALGKRLARQGELRNAHLA